MKTTREPAVKPQRTRAASRLDSFRHAFAGWWYMLRTQRNAWIHAVISTAVFALGLWLGLGRLEWAIILLTIAVVWMAEFINTSLEAVVDLASPDLHPLAEVGKDVAAAAVLVGAVTAVLVGLLVLGPPLWAKISVLFGHGGL
jgi:diacylglycerol kinase (ATP)